MSTNARPFPDIPRHPATLGRDGDAVFGLALVVMPAAFNMFNKAPQGAGCWPSSSHS